MSSVNAAVAAEDISWRQQKTAHRTATVDVPALQTSTVSRGSVVGLTDTERMQVWQLYWTGGRWTHTDAETKLWQIWDRLLGRGDEGAVVLLITPLADESDAVLSGFATTNLAAIDAALVAARDSR